MDRLFLEGLVEELRAALLGRRIQTATARRESTSVHLRLGGKPASTLVWSFLPETAGPFLRSMSDEGKPTPGLKRFAGATIVSLEASPLDRIVTLTTKHRRLSGRAGSTKLILEVFATRADIFVVDGDSEHVVEVFSLSRPRLGLGERYREPNPPPAASLPSGDASELERRLSSLPADASRRSALLAATGWTPLLVREMEWLIDERELSEAEAFDLLNERLAQKEPVLYVTRDASRPGRPCLVSPVTLESEMKLEPRALPAGGEDGTFSGTLRAAVELVTSIRTARLLRDRIAAALGRRLDKARRLHRNLSDEAATLPEASTLRRRGESLLAGLARAKRLPGTAKVVVPDLYHPTGGELELDIDPRMPLPANAERLFRRARKSERSRVQLERRIAAVADEIERWESRQLDLRDATERWELEALEREAIEEGLLEARKEPRRKEKAKGGADVRLGPRTFRSHRGRAILVGRSGRSNEELTFDIAKPDDLWLHAAGSPGAHVVVRLEPGDERDPLEVEQAAGLAAYFSKRRDEAAVDVMVTERRNVSKIKGAPKGLVKVRIRETVRVAPRLLAER